MTTENHRTPLSFINESQCKKYALQIAREYRTGWLPNRVSPDGWKKESTKSYWLKVKAVMEKKQCR